MAEVKVSTVQNPDETTTLALTAPAGSINWAALLQAVVSALPAILAIISAFTGKTPAPTPTPSPIPPAPLKEVTP